jgi:hypothetical protein
VFTTAQLGSLPSGLVVVTLATPVPALVLMNFIAEAVPRVTAPRLRVAF